VARTLSQGFSLVRVDFYLDAEGKPKFGEMTFTPASGLLEFSKPEYSRIFGDLLELPTLEG